MKNILKLLSSTDLFKYYCFNMAILKGYLYRSACHSHDNDFEDVGIVGKSWIFRGVCVICTIEHWDHLSVINLLKELDIN